jgi:DNA-binding transcriptional LysR family regulator
MLTAVEMGDTERMEIRELRAFVAVVEEGGLSAAARRLHVSQSALSQTVQSLERQLGVRLLLRDYTGARPTEAGRVLVDEARVLLDHHDRIAAMVTGSASPAGGLLRVGVPLEFPVDLLPAVFAELKAVHPEVKVQVRHATGTVQLAALRAGELEVALVRDRPADPQLDSVLAVEEAMGVILTTERSDELAEGNGVRLHRLAGMAWIDFARSDSPAWHDQVMATLRAHGITSTDSASDDNRPVTPEVKLAAVSSRAFAFASPGWARPLPDGLVWHPLVGNPIVRRTWAVWNAESRQRELATLIAALDIES